MPVGRPRGSIERPNEVGISEVRELEAAGSEAALAAVRERLDLTAGSLAKELGSLGLGKDFVLRMKEFFKKDEWGALERKEKFQLMRLVLKLAEIVEGQKLTVRMEGAGGATREELAEATEAIMQQWRKAVLPKTLEGLKPPQTA